ncbi:Cysteine-rich repeat secretory protein 55 [Linum grandiflorum]
MKDFFGIRNALYITTSFLALLYGYTQADVNQVMGWSCSGPKNTTILDRKYQTPLETLLDSLAKQAPLQNGFYQNDVGNHDKRLYGLVQCRGDISARNCKSCILNATSASVGKGCASNNDVMIWLRWCFLRYSNKSFYGTWDGTGIAEAKETTPFEDPGVVSQGVELMNELSVTTPRRASMFETRMIDLGPKSGKRYGMAQCTRDMDVEGCARCLKTQLATFRTTIGNKRGWEIYGSTCSLWYHDYQFYFNSTSVPGSSEGQTSFRVFVITLQYSI